MTILIVDDDPLQRRFVAQLLSGVDDLVFLSSAEETLAVIDSIDNISVMIIDVVLGRMNGIELIKKICSVPELSHIPLVAYSGFMTVELSEMALDAGATVAMEKSVELRIFLAQIKALVRCSTRSGTLRSEQPVDLEVFRAPDKSIIYKAIDGQMRDAKRLGYGLTLCFLDLDKFKDINTRFGHVAGDIVLSDFFCFLKTKFNRSNDHIYRFGGDEFVVTFLSKDIEDSKSALNNLYSNKFFSRSNNKPGSEGFEVGFTAAARFYGPSFLEGEIDVVECIAAVSKKLLIQKASFRGNYAIE